MSFCVYIVQNTENTTYTFKPFFVHYKSLKQLLLGIYETKKQNSVNAKKIQKN